MYDYERAYKRDMAFIWTFRVVCIVYAAGVLYGAIASGWYLLFYLFFPVFWWVWSNFMVRDARERRDHWRERARERWEASQ